MWPLLVLIVAVAAHEGTPVCAPLPSSQAPYLDSSTGIEHPSFLVLPESAQSYMVLGASRWQNLSVALFVDPVSAAKHLDGLRGRSGFELRQQSVSAVKDQGGVAKARRARRRFPWSNLPNAPNMSPLVLRFVLTENESIYSLQEKFRGHLAPRLAFDVPSHAQQLLNEFDTLFVGLEGGIQKGAELVFTMLGDDLSLQMGRSTVQQRNTIENVPFLAHAFWSIFSEDDDANDPNYDPSRLGDRMPLLWLDRPVRFWLQEAEQRETDKGRPAFVELAFYRTPRATQVLVLTGNATQPVTTRNGGSVDVSLYVEQGFSQAVQGLNESFGGVVHKLVHLERAIRVLRLQASTSMFSLDMVASLSRLLVAYLQSYNSQAVYGYGKPVFNIQATVNQFLRQIPIVAMPSDVFYIALVPEQQMDKLGSAVAVLLPNDKTAAGARTPITGVAARVLSDALLAAYLQPVGLMTNVQCLALVAGLVPSSEPVPYDPRVDDDDTTSDAGTEEEAWTTPNFLEPVLVVAGLVFVATIAAGFWPSNPPPKSPEHTRSSIRSYGRQAPARTHGSELHRDSSSLLQKHSVIHARGGGSPAETAAFSPHVASTNLSNDPGQVPPDVLDADCARSKTEAHALERGVAYEHDERYRGVFAGVRTTQEERDRLRNAHDDAVDVSPALTQRQDSRHDHQFATATPGSTSGFPSSGVSLTVPTLSPDTDAMVRTPSYMI